MELKVSDRRVLSGGVSVGIIIGVAVAVLLLVIVAVGVFIWKKKQSGKGNEGFKQVPVNPNGSSETSSNNS
ncbi:hypothetical protein MHYP_G00262370 [Metynnis hypsauchen]